MFIKSEHIYLRALEQSDIAILYNIENDTSIWKVSNTLTPFSKTILEEYVKVAHQDLYINKQVRFMICLNNTNEAIGTIDLFDFDPMHFRIGLGIFIFDTFREKGYAKQAIELIKEYTFNTLLVNQVFCNISKSNTNSIKLFENCDFIKSGIKKQWNRIAINEFEDELMYQYLSPKN